MAKTTINRQQLVLEFISVVFAVLLALFLNGWRENAATAKVLNKVKQTIRTEILANDTSVQKALAYHKDLIKELRDGTHLIMSQAVADFPIDVNNDAALTSYLQKVLPFLQTAAVDRLEIQRLDDDQRVLTLNNKNMRLAIENDTLHLYGSSNIQLYTADVSNRSWEIAQATGILVEMDLALVDALNKCYNMNNRYLETSDIAIDMVYKGDPEILYVLEDMALFEQRILKADSILLRLLD